MNVERLQLSYQATHRAPYERLAIYNPVVHVYQRPPRGKYDGTYFTANTLLPRHKGREGRERLSRERERERERREENLSRICKQENIHREKMTSQRKRKRERERRKDRAGDGKGERVEMEGRKGGWELVKGKREDIVTTTTATTTIDRPFIPSPLPASQRGLWLVLH
ncbi:hypothetical protein BDY19DRAFT_703397 [Irpex rosettiformis]|uniref:Uncharacterized protein n=1 Tax=Irpex rosettiformis TaxID=378272 RepID=A0ACB8TMY3_9APHY|nr:hypothetical protein BDY19DRAFT_703397 [Irpex rosettiformis]